MNSSVDSISFVVCGAPRSGTSLLSSLISSNKQVSIAHDSGVFFFLKHAIACFLTNRIGGRGVNEAFVWNSLYRNNFLDNQQIKGSLENLFQSSIADILEGKSLDKELLEDYMKRLWSFWVNDFNIPDPTKDRNKYRYFLESINPQELLSANSFRESMSKYLKLLASCGSSQSDGPIVVYGEKTPENCVCGDLITIYNPDIKAIHIKRNPISLYGAKKRRGTHDSPEKFAEWYSVFSKHYYFKSNNVFTLNYADLIAKPLDILNQIYFFIGLPGSENIDLMPPSVYRNYVGTKIDPSREEYLLNLVEESEKTIILDCLDKLNNA